MWCFLILGWSRPKIIGITDRLSANAESIKSIKYGVPCSFPVITYRLVQSSQIKWSTIQILASPFMFTDCSNVTQIVTSHLVWCADLNVTHKNFIALPKSLRKATAIMRYLHGHQRVFSRAAVVGIRKK